MLIIISEYVNFKKKIIPAVNLLHNNKIKY